MFQVELFSADIPKPLGNNCLTSRAYQTKEILYQTKHCIPNSSRQMHILLYPWLTSEINIYTIWVDHTFHSNLHTIESKDNCHHYTEVGHAFWKPLIFSVSRRNKNYKLKEFLLTFYLPKVQNFQVRPFLYCISELLFSLSCKEIYLHKLEH